MTFILENVLFAFNYFIVTTGTLIPSTTTVPQVSTKSSPIVASHSSTVLPESTTSSEKQTTISQGHLYQLFKVVSFSFNINTKRFQSLPFKDKKKHSRFI
jgi:hypothetical protein